MKKAIKLGMALLLCSANTYAQTAEVGAAHEPGLSVTQILTHEGKIKVYLPESIKAGDRISGTVMASSKGKNQAETEKNHAYLSGCVVEMEDESSMRSKNSVLSFVAPNVATTLFALIKDSKGKAIARFPITVQSPSIQPMFTPTFEIPQLGQAGTSLLIPGPADGELNNTFVQIGNRTYQPLAESPAGIVIRPEGGAEIGVLPISVKDVSASKTDKIRIVELQLHAARLNLRKNESTSLQVKVLGLARLEEPLTLNLVNESPANVRLEKGNRQEIEISASQIAPDGRFEMTDVIIGSGLGSFNISASVTLRERFLNCGQKRDIYTNFSGNPIQITVEASDNCTGKSSFLKVGATMKIEIPDNSSNSGTFRVNHGEKIVFECLGENNSGCSYIITVH